MAGTWQRVPAILVPKDNMNQISELPSDMAFGTEFDYSTWLNDTKITLTNVPWTAEYKDVWRPPTQAHVDAYIDSRVNTNVKITNASHASINRPIRINVPLNRVLDYNYVRVENPAQPLMGGDKQRNYYYFILQATAVAGNTTELVVELDVWQTFGYDFEFAMCHIERGHLLMAASNAFSRYGFSYLTQPEGLDLGPNYRIIAQRNLSLGQHVVIASTISLRAQLGSPSVSPIVQGANPLTPVQGQYTPTEVYVLDPATVRTYFNNMTRFAYVTRGIYRATVVPSLTEFKGGSALDLEYIAPVPATGSSPQENPPANTLRYPLGGAASRRTISLADDFRAVVRNAMSARLRHLDKFLTAPYLLIEVTDNAGEPIMLNPEQWQQDAASFTMLLSIIPGAERMATYPDNYGGTVAEDISSALVTTNFPQLPVLNDGASIAMAQGAYSRIQARQAADWSYQKAMAANQMAYDNSGISQGMSNDMAALGRGTDTAQTNLGNQTAQQQQQFNAAMGIAGGAATGMVGGPLGGVIGGIGGIAGAIASAGSTAIGIQSNSDSLAIRNAASRAGQSISNAGNNAIRGNNLSLANNAARGDYQASIAAMNAAMRDTRNTPPQMSAALGGDFLNMIQRIPGITVRFRMPSPGDMARIGNYWMRYGYSINLFQEPPADLHCMTKFTYWKMSETYTKQNAMPQFFSNVIQGIFQKGVTVWKNPDDMGVVDMVTNLPLPNIEMSAQ